MKKLSYCTAVYFCVVFFVGCAAAQKGAISRAYSSIDKGKFIVALNRLSEAEKYVEPTPEMTAEITYLRAVCYEGLERFEDAIGALKYLIEKFPDTSYAYQAKEKLKKIE